MFFVLFCFDRLNVSLLNISIKVFKKNLTDLNILNVSAFFVLPLEVVMHLFSLAIIEEKI